MFVPLSKFNGCLLLKGLIMSTDTFGNTTMLIVTDNGIVFLPQYTSTVSFAQLIVNAYNASIPVRLPERELILQQPNDYNTDSTLSNSIDTIPGIANNEISPNVVMSGTDYLTSVTNQLYMLPTGMVITFMVSNTVADTPNVGTSNIQYQNTGNGVWTQVTPYQFNTEIPTESYNEYNDGSNNI